MTDLPLLVRFDVLGGDPVPQGSKGARVVKGRAVLFDTNARTLRPWRRKVSDAARQAWTDAGHAEPFACPVHVDSLFLFDPSKSDPDRVFASTRADGDKLVRAVWDSLKMGGVLRDDALVCRWGGAKRFAARGERAGVRVSVWSLADLEAELSTARRTVRRYRAREAAR